jgi:hypothetical protein
VTKSEAETDKGAHRSSILHDDCTCARAQPLKRLRAQRHILQGFKSVTMHTHCCWGTCKSDSRKKEDGVKFIAFPKPTKYRTIARAWVQLCGRGGFTESSINRYTYICSKHFPPGADLDYKKNEVCIKPTTFCLNPKMFSLISTHIYCKPS